MLAAEHVLQHACTRYNEKDLALFSRWGLRPPAACKVNVSSATTRYAASSLYALLLAAGLVLFRTTPFAAATLVNSLLLAWTLVALGRVEIGAKPGRRWLFAFTLVFASVTFAQVFLVQPTLLACALVASAWLLALAPRRPAHTPMPEVYDVPLEPARWREALRWVGVGSLLALAGTLEPAYWLFLLGAALLLPRYRRRPSGIALLSGIAVVAAAVLIFPSLLSGWGGQIHSVALNAAPRGAAVVAHLQPADPSIGAALGLAPHWPLALGVHDLLFFLLGRNLGILPYFLPLLALLVVGWRNRERLPLVLAAGAAVVFLIASRPFDFGGVPGSVGNRLFVPIYVTLWFLLTVPLRRAWSLAVLLASGIFLYPLWVSPLSSVVPVKDHWRYPSYLAQRFLPFEETQSGVPAPSTKVEGVSFRVTRGSLQRPTSPVVIRTLPNGRAEVVIDSADKIPGLYIESSRTPPVALGVVGGRLSETMFRADGRVVFHIQLKNSGYRRPRETQGLTTWIYTVKLRASGAAPKGYALALSTDAAGSWSPFPSEPE